jgi:hypothetical protein
MSWENIRLSDLPCPTEAEIAELIENFEHDYEEFREQEQNPVAPAIFARDLFARPKQPVNALVPDFVYAGAITAIFAAPKVGKSTLLWHVLQAASQQQEVLGRKTVKSRVLYASEQNEASFRYQAQEVPGLDRNDNFAILLIEDNKIKRPLRDGTEKPVQITSWEAQLLFWAELIKSTEADIFVIDTLGALFHLPMGGENDNGLMQQRMAQLRCLFDIKPSLAIFLSHHNRKDDKTDYREKDGVYGTLADGRGASAIGGAVDHAIILTKKPGDSPIRYLKFEGRYRESNGMTMDIELLPDNTYSVLQENRPSAVRGHYQSTEEKVRLIQLDRLKASLPVLEGDAKSIAQLKHETGLDPRTLSPLLQRLGARMKGKGAKGEPFRYWLPAPIFDVENSAENPILNLQADPSGG